MDKENKTNPINRILRSPNLDLRFIVKNRRDIL